MAIDKKSGLMVPPVYPCYKGEGLCALRTVETDSFECTFAAAICHFREVTKVEATGQGKTPEPPTEEPQQDETAKLWADLAK